LLNCSVYHFPYDSDMFKSSVQKETLIQKLLELKGGASLSDTLKGYLRKSILHHS
ncbi:MAG TPA: serine/threonine protein kinase, partial [Eubacterium sp.]|nr:serine/threonine protein kinase [Eubacterium sp.]